MIVTGAQRGRRADIDYVLYLQDIPTIELYSELGRRRVAMRKSWGLPRVWPEHRPTAKWCHCRECKELRRLGKAQKG